MVTEVVNETVNIGDYIWYIIGGIVLFFVLVGFIADKSGLIKKTFGKDSKSNNKVVPPVNTAPANNQISEPVIELDQEAAINMDRILTEGDNDVSIDTPPVALNDIMNVEQDVSSDSAENIENDDSIINSDDFMLDGTDNVVADEMSDGDFMLDSENEENNQEDESQIDNLAEDNSQEEQTEDIIEDNSQEDQEEETTEESNQEEQNIEEDVWGFDDENKLEETADEVSAPDLEEVNSEEDVWKF